MRSKLLVDVSDVPKHLNVSGLYDLKNDEFDIHFHIKGQTLNMIFFFNSDSWIFLRIEMGLTLSISGGLLRATNANESQ